MPGSRVRWAGYAQSPGGRAGLDGRRMTVRSPDRPVQAMVRPPWWRLRWSCTIMAVAACPHCPHCAVRPAAVPAGRRSPRQLQHHDRRDRGGGLLPLGRQHRAGVRRHLTTGYDALQAAGFTTERRPARRTGVHLSDRRRAVSGRGPVRRHPSGHRVLVVLARRRRSEHVELQHVGCSQLPPQPGQRRCVDLRVDGSRRLRWTALVPPECGASGATHPRPPPPPLRARRREPVSPSGRGRGGSVPPEAVRRCRPRPRWPPRHPRASRPVSPPRLPPPHPRPPPPPPRRRRGRPVEPSPGGAGEGPPRRSSTPPRPRSPIHRPVRRPRSSWVG